MLVWVCLPKVYSNLSLEYVLNVRGEDGRMKIDNRRQLIDGLLDLQSAFILAQADNNDKQVR
jgi:hypothetical protein